MKMKRYLRRYHNKVEFAANELQEEDIVSASIQRIVDEILCDIADIFIREKLREEECEMILDSIEGKIKKNRRTRDNKWRKP